MTVSLCSPLNDREEHQLEPQGRRAGEGSGFRQPGTRHLPWLWHEASNEAVRSLPVRVWRARRVRDDAMTNVDQPIPRFREFPDRAFTPFDEDERRLLRRYVQQAEDLKGCGFWKGDRKLQLTIQGKQGERASEAQISRRGSLALPPYGSPALLPVRRTCEFQACP